MRSMAKRFIALRSMIRPSRVGGVLTLIGLTLLSTDPVAAQGFAPELLENLEWDDIGPARGGRSQAIAGSVARPNEYFFGAVGGGLWKTEDGGENWRPVTDGQINSSSVGAVAVCEANPDVVYIGMGETALRGNIQQGDGVYKSIDGGETWEHLGLEETQNVSRLRIHPGDCNTVLVAALGKHSTSNPERGIFKTTDGGTTWRKVLYEDENSGGVDLSVHPNNPDVMYAALWEVWRKSWGMSSGGPGSGLYKSVDGGETWTNISRSSGLPQEGVFGKIGVAVSPVDIDRVYAIIEHENGGIFRSDDGGRSWELTNEDRRFRQRAFYYTRIYADPVERDGVYVLNTGFYGSEDGGETFPQQYRVPHGDNHDLWIAADDSNRMANANDGGGNVSIDGGQSWTAQDFSTAQFYRVTTTSHVPYHICGAQQDNSTACVPSSGWNHLSNTTGRPEFLYAVGGGESGYIAPHPENTNIFFAGSYGGALTRYDHATGMRRPINVWPDNPMGWSAEDMVERVQWTFPIVFSHHDSNVIYTGTQKVWKTTTEGESWEAISPDLTRADPSTMGPSGGPITKDQTGVETYATVFAIAPSYHDPNVIWSGSDDGYVQVTRNGGTSWSNVTPPDAPDFVRINTIEASPTTPGKAYVAGIRYLVDDDRSPYIWKTDDYGATWTKIVNGIGADDFVRAVREDPYRPGLLYAGSEKGVYVSWDDGANWQSLSQNLPVVQVSDLVVEENDLVIGTHGRSFWVMRDISLLRQLTPQVAQADVHLFDPVDPRRGLDNGVLVRYRLTEDAEEVKVEFLDASGEIIRTLESNGAAAGPPAGGRGGFGGRGPSTAAGLNQVQWNLRYPGYTDFDGRIFWAAGNQGPAAAPGRYQVRLTVDGKTQTQDFEVRMDPRLEGVTVADLQARFDLAIAVRDRVGEANEAVIRIRDIKGQVDDRLDDTENLDIERLGEEVKTSLGAVEQEIYQVRNQSSQDPLNFPIKLNNKLAALIGQIEGGEDRPTEQSYEVFEYLSQLLQVELDQLEVVIRQEISRLNDLLEAENLPPIRTSNLISED